MPRSSAHRRSHRRSGRRVDVVLGVAGAACLVALAACDTGDGRELRPPTAPPPSITVATTPDDAGADAGLDAGVDSGAIPDVGDVDDTSALLPDFEFEVFAAWRDGAPIDARHTCDGADVSPALTWTGVPDGTVELAISVLDEHAEGFVHWVVTGIDPASVSTLDGSVPPGASELDNSFGEPGWAGPCPPEGSTHTYRFTVHALDQQIEGLDPTSPAEAVALLDGLALASTSVTGTYGR